MRRTFWDKKAFGETKGAFGLNQWKHVLLLHSGIVYSVLLFRWWHGLWCCENGIDSIVECNLSSIVQDLVLELDATHVFTLSKEHTGMMSYLQKGPLEGFTLLVSSLLYTSLPSFFSPKASLDVVHK
jgi:hypothetical protein